MFPEGMGLIIRTAGSKRTKTENQNATMNICCSLWENVRNLTLESTAPSLWWYEEGSLVKRAIRDSLRQRCRRSHGRKDKRPIRKPRPFMKMLTPSHAKECQNNTKISYALFQRYQVERHQLDQIYNPQVQLKSGRLFGHQPDGSAGVRSM